MNEGEGRDDDVFPLSEEQKKAALEDLHRRGATFFTWEQLQSWIRRIGPKTKMKDAKEAIRNQEDQEPKL